MTSGNCATLYDPSFPSSSAIITTGNPVRRGYNLGSHCSAHITLAFNRAFKCRFTCLESHQLQAMPPTTTHASHRYPCLPLLPMPPAITHVSHCYMPPAAAQNALHPVSFPLSQRIAPLVSPLLYKNVTVCIGPSMVLSKKLPHIKRKKFEVQWERWVPGDRGRE